MEQETIRQIASYEESEILKAISQVVNLEIPHTAYEMRRDEFHAMLQAAEEGHPPEAPKRRGEVPNFEVQASQVRPDVYWNNLRFRITPISRLRVLMVQHAYRRIPAGKVTLAQSVSTAFGTLGGLIALVPEFERVLERALHNLDTCSNDPLCGEEEFGKNHYNGAACYACALISETSCEHRNMSLDRKLLLEGLP
ncbi:MAG: hypothetical protein Fur0035_08900 [Anaerolineales bacterium]